VLIAGLFMLILKVGRFASWPDKLLVVQQEICTFIHNYSFVFS
jgi:hypothetical protein